MQFHYFQDQQSGDFPLIRRGFEYGSVSLAESPAMPTADEIKSAWAENQAILLPGILADKIPHHQAEIAQAHELMEQTREGEELSELLEAEPYISRLEADFSLSGSSLEEHDDQGISKVIFDAWQDDDIIAENLWCKASWLSFDDEDGSLRFRFSFGFEGYEDVAADPARQDWAAKLTDAIFPESAIITENPALNALMAAMLDTPEVRYAERIIYFNAPNGGAQFHHDVERGHAGVIFAQLSGATFWLAIAKLKLVDEILAFLAGNTDPRWAELRELAGNRQALSAYLEEQDHELAEQLIDQSAAFFEYLIGRGYGYLLRAGDVLLMPQSCLDTCVWHSVMCVGEEEGEALSFAMKRVG